MVGIQSSPLAGKKNYNRKHSPEARVFYISLEFSNARRVLSQCNTRLRLLYLLNILNQGTLSISTNRSYSFLDGHLLCDTFFILSFYLE